MAYQYPPWIQPPESLARNFGAGVAAGQNQQEMQLRAQSDAARLQLQQQAQLQEEAYRARQQGISEQELAMNQQLSAAKVREIQQAFDARQQYQHAIQSGEDPIKAGFKYLAPAGESMTGWAQLARQQRMDTNAQVPPSLVNFPDPNNPGKMLSFVKHPTEGGYGLTPAHEYGSARESLSALDSKALDDLFYEKRRLQAELVKLDSEPQIQMARAKPTTPLAKAALDQYRAVQDQYDAVQKEIDSFYQDRGRAGQGALKGTRPPGPGRVKIISVEDLAPPGGTNAPPLAAPPGAAIAPPTAPGGSPIRAAQALGLSLGQNVMGAVNAPGASPKVADSLQDWWSGLFGPTQGP